ncbi:MAG: gamma-glutamyltransferase [Verrucomicrobia bacterium]|nr:gamma-glutamyltransferase [Verrucomicrobiota bacterium]
MQKFFILAQITVLTLLLGCGEKPATSVTKEPAKTNEVSQTNEQAEAEEEEETPKESRIAFGEKGMVVSVHPLATQAGVEVLKNGGNAIDAAVAVALTLGVVDSHNSGIGGGCFILIRRANGAYNAIDGRETAPAAATRDMYLRDGKADPDLSQTGPLAIATPGALAAYESAIRKFGKTKLGDHLMAAAKIAEDGFPVNASFAAANRNTARNLAQFEDSKRIFLKDGKPLQAGDMLKQPDLAKTYRSIASDGIGWFYGGPFAEATEAWMKKNGGILTVADLKGYTPVAREPLFSNYRGYTIATFPPPSSGGVHLIQILQMAETQNLYEMRRNGVDVIHFLAEAMKLAFADRAHWLGDPDWVKVPKHLINRQYCRELAAKIQMDKVIDVPSHGIPPEAEAEVFASQYGKHTTHFAAADAEGNWVAITATVNTSYGSKVVIPGTGVVMNNEMDDFAAEPGSPNAFGLLGAEANAVAPFKRPLSSMTPTIVSLEGEPVLAVGAAGGPTIINQVALTIINFIDMRMQGGHEMEEFELSLYDALATPRFHHQWKPDELRIEKKWVEDIRKELTARGHKLQEVERIGACQALARHPDGKGLIGCPDPRGLGKAEGF